MSHVAVITGCNCGIGKETARELHAKGYELVFACRNKERAEEAMADIAKKNGTDKRLVFIVPFDTSSLASVKAFCEEFLKKYTRLDALVCNAGTGYLKRDDRITKDGFEGVFQSNYLGHFLMLLWLTPVLKKTEASRVVCLSSVEHRMSKACCDWETLAKKTTSVKSYPSSKLAMTFLPYEYQRRTSILTAAVNPGGVYSDIWRYLKGFQKTMMQVYSKTVLLTTEQGCATSVYAATEKLPAGPVYYSPYRVYDCCAVGWDYIGPFAGPRQCHSSPLSHDTKEAAKLWAFSLECVKSFLPANLESGLS
jgi:NAD(P)-dependent dehydrogenase (short-subunit alcohol dehydrogenase family)